MNTAQATTERMNATTIETTTEQRETKPSEICFGAMMGMAALYGIWQAVSLLISYCVG